MARKIRGLHKATITTAKDVRRYADPWLKQHPGNRNLARLEDWVCVSSLDKNNQPYDYLCGRVYSHKDHADGKIIRTTRILDFKWDKETEEGFAVTKNTVYLFGKRA